MSIYDPRVIQLLNSRYAPIAPLMGPSQDPAMEANASPVAQGSLLASSSAPPEVPDWAIPKVLPDAKPGVSGGIAAAMANTPDYQKRPYESAGSQFFGGLLTGAQQGFSAATLGHLKNLDQKVALKNKVESENAARTNAVLTDQYKAKLADHYQMLKDERGGLVINSQYLKDHQEIDPAMLGKILPVGDVLKAAAELRKNPTVPASKDVAGYFNMKEGTPITAELSNMAQKAIEDKRHNLETERVANEKYKQGLAGGDPERFSVLVKSDPYTAQQYLDLTNVQPKDMLAAMAYGKTHGLGALNKVQVSKMHNIEDALTNIDNMQGAAETFLSKKGKNDLLGRVTDAAGNKWQEITRTGEHADLIASWKTWRVAAIQQLVALAGGQGSGLRVNQAEIMQATENDIPRVTDPWDVAQRKMANVRQLLAMARNAQLGNEVPPIYFTVDKDGVSILHEGIKPGSQAEKSEKAKGAAPTMKPITGSGTVQFDASGNPVQ